MRARRHRIQQRQRQEWYSKEVEDDPFLKALLMSAVVVVGALVLFLYLVVFRVEGAKSTRNVGAPATVPYAPPEKQPLEYYQNLCGGRKCKIAVVACASSRGIYPDFDKMALIEFLIPSLIRTAEADLFSYALYIGIDEDDVFWNNPINKKKLKSFVKSKMSAISMGGRVVSFPQPSVGGKRIPMNEIITVAYKDGADYIVRINDDTEFVSKGWTSVGVGTLLAMNPPNIGVVGPTCFEGKTEILTHDMVHRTHFEIFEGKYYPPVFKNWFLDDWISMVYRDERTRKIPASYWEVKHHINYHGTRYDIAGDEWMLKDELRKGRRKVENWLRSHKSKARNIPVLQRLHLFLSWFWRTE